MEAPPHWRIILVSKTGAGKSSAGNTILGQEHFEKRASLQSVTRTCARGEAQIDNRVISVIDTPGLFDTAMSEEQLRNELVRCIEMSVPGPHVFLLVIRLGVRYTKEDRNSLRWIQQNFGEDAVHYTIILFTHTDLLRGKSLDEYINESNVLQALVNECGRRFHSFNNKDMGNRSQVTDLLNAIDEMVRINGGQHYTNEIYQEAQDKLKWEPFKQKLKKALIEGGKTAVALLAGAVGGGGGGAAAATTGVAAIAARGAAAAATGVAAIAARGAAAAGTTGAAVAVARGAAATTGVAAIAARGAEAAATGVAAIAARGAAAAGTTGAAVAVARGAAATTGVAAIAARGAAAAGTTGAAVAVARGAAATTGVAAIAARGAAAAATGVAAIAARGAEAAGTTGAAVAVARGAAATTGVAAIAARGAEAAATTGAAVAVARGAEAAATRGVENRATEAATSVLTGRGIIFAAAAGGAALLVLSGIGKGVLTKLKFQ